MKIKPMAIILTMFTGWINRRQRQQQAIEYLKEENKILKEVIHVVEQVYMLVRLPSVS